MAIATSYNNLCTISHLSCNCQLLNDTIKKHQELIVNYGDSYILYQSTLFLSPTVDIATAHTHWHYFQIFSTFLKLMALPRTPLDERTCGAQPVPLGEGVLGEGVLPHYLKKSSKVTSGVVSLVWCISSSSFL